VSIPLEVIIAHVQEVFGYTTGGDAGMWMNALSTIHAKTELVAPTHRGVIRAPVVAAVSLERTVIRMWTNAPSRIHAKTELVALTHTEVIRATVAAVSLERTVIRLIRCHDSNKDQRLAVKSNDRTTLMSQMVKISSIQKRNVTLLLKCIVTKIPTIMNLQNILVWDTGTTC